MSYSVHINLIDDDGTIDYDIVDSFKADRLSDALALVESVVINRPVGEAYDLTLIHTPERKEADKAALTKADRARIADALRYAAKPLPYADTEKVALLDLAGRIEKGLTR